MRLLHVGHGFTPFHHGGLVSYAEDLMRGQVGRGHEVSYFFSGRQYPLGRQRLRNWRRSGVRMHEVLNPEIVFGGDFGTRRPDLEVEHPPTERSFRALLRAAQPDVVHVHELSGLPSSLLDVGREQGVPVLMTLHDYFALCPTVKLFDVDGAVCLRAQPADQCVRCCRSAPADAGEQTLETLRVHRAQAASYAPILDRAPRPRALLRRLRGEAGPAPPTLVEGEEADSLAGTQPDFAARRLVNLERLSRADRLVAVSPRVAEMYETLGVQSARMRVLHPTLARLETLRPREVVPQRPVRFVTLAGCASMAKGAGVVADALETLTRAGLTDRDLTLSVAGPVEPSVGERLAASALVRRLDRYAPTDLDAMLDEHDVGIVPSLWEEAHGFVGIELLAKGLPVVGNATGGIVDYVREGETGWLNRDRDGAGLARILETLVRVPSQITDMSRRVGARRAELVVPMGAHLDAVEDLYAEIAGVPA